jgi:hypothetical protein
MPAPLPQLCAFAAAVVSYASCLHAAAAASYSPPRDQNGGQGMPPQQRLCHGHLGYAITELHAEWPAPIGTATSVPDADGHVLFEHEGGTTVVEGALSSGTCATLCRLVQPLIDR